MRYKGLRSRLPYTIVCPIRAPLEKFAIAHRSPSRLSNLSLDQRASGLLLYNVESLERKPEGYTKGST